MLAFAPLSIFCESLLILTVVLAANGIEYIIYPQEGLAPQLHKDLERLIARLAGSPTNLYASKSIDTPFAEYWVATLPNNGYDRLREDSSVDSIFPNEPLVEPFDDYTTQQRAPQELTVVSQPEDTGEWSYDRYPNYVYRSSPQKDIFVYHAELGINARHEDFKNRRIEWLYTGFAIKRQQDVPEESPLSASPGHSTCTASKAVGNIYGAAKFATLVAVKMPDYTAGSTGEIFRTIAEHVRLRGRQHRSLVIVSWGSTRSQVEMERDETLNRPRAIMKRYLDQLGDMGVLSIFAAGNSAEQKRGRHFYRLPIDTEPASYGIDIRLGMAVSNCDNQGRRWPTSQDFGPPSKFAPGVNVQCATHNSNWKHQRKTGTSFSAALFAGVLANWLAHGEIGDYRTLWFWTRGWERTGGEYVIWNRVNSTDNPASEPFLNREWLNNTLNDTLPSFQ